jgi:hypothetical protein
MSWPLIYNNLGKAAKEYFSDHLGNCPAPLFFINPINSKHNFEP